MSSLKPPSPSATYGPTDWATPPSISARVAAASASPKVTGVPKTSQASSTGCHPVHRHM